MEPFPVIFFSLSVKQEVRDFFQSKPRFFKTFLLGAKIYTTFLLYKALSSPTASFPVRLRLTSIVTSSRLLFTSFRLDRLREIFPVPSGHPLQITKPTPHRPLHRLIGSQVFLNPFSSQRQQLSPVNKRTKGSDITRFNLHHLLHLLD